jgi:adenylate kinase
MAKVIRKSALCFFALIVFCCSISSCPATEAYSDRSPCISAIRKTQPVIIVILGHPGSGKGTFAQGLRDKDVIHLSLGDFLRSEFRNKTDIGLRWKEEIQTYGILAISVVKEVTTDLIMKIDSSPAQVYILDGHVRTLEQAQHLDKLLTSCKNIYPIFIYINTEKEEAFRRILNRRTCGKCNYIYNLESLPTQRAMLCDDCDGILVQRDTDNQIHAKNRINTYAPHLEETVEYYKNKNILIEFDGNLPLQEYLVKSREFFECLPK